MSLAGTQPAYDQEKHPITASRLAAKEIEEQAS
jgi:hypothetical protein